LKKLTRFFENSRDRWKAKCLDSKRRVKLLHTKVADLKASRERWKAEAKQLRQELTELRRELEKTAGADG
jgi:hypothetical protein